MINIVQNKTYIKKRVITRILRYEFHINMKISSQLTAIDSAAVDIDVTDCIYYVDKQRQFY